MLIWLLFFPFSVWNLVLCLQQKSSAKAQGLKMKPAVMAETNKAIIHLSSMIMMMLSFLDLEYHACNWGEIKYKHM